MHEQIWIMVKWIGVISCFGLWIIGILHYLFSDVKDKENE